MDVYQREAKFRNGVSPSPRTGCLASSSKNAEKSTESFLHSDRMTGHSYVVESFSRSRLTR